MMNEQHQRPKYLIEAEMKLFRSWPAIMHSLCVAWGRCSLSASEFFEDRSRRSSLFQNDCSSRRHRKELDELQIGQIQTQIIELITPFFLRHQCLVFVAVLNN